MSFEGNQDIPHTRDNEQRLVDAGVLTDKGSFVDDFEGPAYSFDEEAVEQRSESARKRLLGDEIPSLGSFGFRNDRSQRVQSGETGASIVGAARGLRTAISKLKSEKQS